MSNLLALKDTPVPTILVIAGLIFIFLAMGGQLKDTTSPPQRWMAGMFGLAMMIVGITLYILPRPSPNSSNPTPTSNSASIATAAPIISPATPESAVPQAANTKTVPTTEIPSLTSTAILITTPTPSSSATSYIPLPTPIAKGFPNIQGNGTKHLILAAEDVAIGDADKYQDLLEQTDPQFTIFVIYGPIDTDISLFWGGWDQWGYASPAFITEQIQKKVDELKRNHPQDHKRRGYRIIECSGQITNCTTIQNHPTEP